MIKDFFLQNEYNIFKKDLYFIWNTNIFCVIIYFWSEIYIFYIFSYIFLCKSVFFSKKIFRYGTVFPYKFFFSANNVYFVKNTNIFSKKTIFSQLSFAANEQPYSKWRKCQIHKSIILSIISYPAFSILFRRKYTIVDAVFLRLPCLFYIYIHIIVYIYIYIYIYIYDIWYITHNAYKHIPAQI